MDLPHTKRIIRVASLLALLFIAAHSHAQTYPAVGYGALIPQSDHLPSTPLEVFQEVGDPLPIQQSIDLSSWFPPPGNQHRQFSCVAWAWAYGVQSYFDNRRNGRTYAPTELVNPDHTYSPAFVFNEYKQVGDTTSCAYPVDEDRFLDLCQKMGTCSLSDMPYDSSITACETPVPSNALSIALGKALQNQLAGYVVLEHNNVLQWKEHLSLGQAILALFVVDSVSFMVDGFKAARAHEPFVWNLKDFKGTASGGHAMACTGYSDVDSTFTCMNSWGTDWGTHGYVKVPYSVFRKKCFGGYAFSMEQANNIPIPPGKAVADSVRTGARVQVAMDPTDHVYINGLRVEVMDVSPDHPYARVAVGDVDSVDPPSVIRFIFDQPYTFYEGGLSIRLSCTRMPWYCRLFGKEMKVLALSKPTGDDPYLQTYRAHLEKIHQTMK
jgi:Papain family cysteine protease